MKEKEVGHILGIEIIHVEYLEKEPIGTKKKFIIVLELVFI